MLICRAQLAKIRAYQARHGWHVPWYSSHGSDFNYDFQVSLDESAPRSLISVEDRGCSSDQNPSR